MQPDTPVGIGIKMITVIYVVIYKTIVEVIAYVLHGLPEQRVFKQYLIF